MRKVKWQPWFHGHIDLTVTKLFLHWDIESLAIDCLNNRWDCLVRGFLHNSDLDLFFTLVHTSWCSVCISCSQFSWSVAQGVGFDTDEVITLAIQWILGLERWYVQYMVLPSCSNPVREVMLTGPKGIQHTSWWAGFEPASPFLLLTFPPLHHTGTHTICDNHHQAQAFWNTAALFL